MANPSGHEVSPSVQRFSPTPEMRSPLVRWYENVLSNDTLPLFSNTAPENSYENMRTQHLETFWRTTCQAYPEIYAAWNECGIMAPEIKDESGNITQQETRNIARHNAVAGAYADLLCDLLGIASQEKEDIVLAAMLHDANKLAENEALDNALTNSDGNLPTKAILDEVKTNEKKLFNKLGLADRVITLAGANVPPKPLDAESRKNLPAMVEAMTHEMSLAEKVIWFVDGMLLDETPMGTSLRLEIGRGFGKEPQTPRQKRNASLNTIMGEYYGHPYYDIQKVLGEHITVVLTEKIIERYPAYTYLEGGLRLAGFLVDRMSDKIQHKPLAPQASRRRR